MENKILVGDSLEVLKQLPSNFVNTCITSPPYYGLRNYGIDGQMGLEESPKEYVEHMVELFREVKRVLRDDGTFWLNIGDTYNGTKNGNTETNKNKKQVTNSFKKKMSDIAKNKDLLGIPWMLAFALRDDGWYLRADIIWNKPNAMPDGAKDRPTKSHEYIFLLTKNPKYYYDAEAIKEDAKNGTKRNKRTVWDVNTKPIPNSKHIAPFPPNLIEPCILAGSPKNGIILDPFIGSGTVGIVARKNERNFIGIELNPDYAKIAEKRILEAEQPTWE